MMNNNKILTVSYGTFSCTLEGFDDSFDTMKAIAEYFRDLASDDRYFGAEPPQPDADMLAKIAEREVARRVEAHEHEGRIMLKAHEDDTTEAPQAAPLMAPAAMPVADAVVEAEHSVPEEDIAETADDVAPIADVVEDTVDEPEEAIATEDSAAAFFANSPTATEASEENDGTEEISVEAFTNYIAAGTAAEADAPVASDGSADAEPVHEEAEDEIASDDAEDTDDAVATTLIADTQDEGEVAEDKDASHGDDYESSESLTDDVKIEETPRFEDDSSEAAVDEVASEEAALTVEDIEPAAKSIFAAENFADKLQRIRDVVERRDEEEDAEYEEEGELSAEALTSFDKMNELSASKATDAESYTADAASDIENALSGDEAGADDPLSDENDELDNILSRIDAATAAEEDADDDLSAPMSLKQPLSDENIFGTDMAETDEDTEEDTENVSVDGRILKVNRSALDAALEAGALEEYSETDDQVVDAAAEDDGADGKTARQSLPEIDESAGTDVSRLMAEADNQMDEPEGKTRRSAFAHLRAAVAARFADRSMDKDAEQEEEKETEAYRSDLAEVVKPRRPVASQDESNRSTSSRPSPLKLVAEQRIDPEDHDQDDFDAVSPRRVAASVAEELILEEDSGFAEYADERGANTLPDVLEAAAAYLSHVEGVEQFSRPQLMSRVKQAECGEFSREDGLRAFGQLLRTGKIEKIKGGRFVASDAIGFKPGHRAAG